MIKKIEWTLLGVASIIVLVFTLNWAVRTAIHFKKNVVVPDLSSQSLLESLEILSKLNLGLKQEGAELNESVPAGTILRQQPPPGMFVREGKILRVTISQGGESNFVPDLNGLSLRSAEIALRLNNLSLGEVKGRPSLKHKKDTVIYQDPPAKTILQKKALVHLIVSDGPPKDGLLLMPNFVGRETTQASAWAKEIRINAKVIEKESPMDPGTVISQSVAPDDVIHHGMLIRFIVSIRGEGTGPKFMYEVPQGDDDNHFKFVLIDNKKKMLLWEGEPPPGKKLEFILPGDLSSKAKIRIFVNDIKTEERRVQ